MGYKRKRREREENTKREERMYKINEKLSEALDNNTKAIQELKQVITKEGF